MAFCFGVLLSCHNFTMFLLSVLFGSFPPLPSSPQFRFVSFSFSTFCLLRLWHAFIVLVFPHFQASLVHVLSPLAFSFPLAF